MTAELTFVDTNILVYAHDVDAGEKHERASALIADLWGSRSGALSTQVLQEFYITVTRKLPTPVAKRHAREAVEDYATWQVYSPNSVDIVAASSLEERRQLSFWDALIVIAAHRIGATRMVSEDFQHGLNIDGLLVSNPFLAPTPG
jgi:predicted nucleic acid-binding protein